MDENLIIEIWDTFKEYIPEKNRDMAANQYVDFLLGHDVKESTLEDYTGYDPHLDDAIATVVNDNSGHDDSDDRDDEYGYDEDEDY